MDRIDLEKLVKIQQITNFDVEIGTEDSSITLRFGYWNELDPLQIEYINEVLGHCHEIVLNWEDYDSDCGRKVDYKIVNK